MFTNASYWHSPGTEPLSPLTMGQLLDVAAERWGDREAVVSVFQNHRITFKQVLNKVTYKNFLSFICNVSAALPWTRGILCLEAVIVGRHLTKTIIREEKQQHNCRQGCL
ncbi:hypothetical protein L798_02982 [Zootermopsis nevadensis]|uniref:Uncharacterized protein n=1 Tax=Zootermopsis nevadensis TaxID=136037 RepID=A0A067RCN9_ZOONE|nr:hypothetical protein L798_02982 [Zootermopsis nevadensis]